MNPEQANNDMIVAISVLLKVDPKKMVKILVERDKLNAYRAALVSATTEEITNLVLRSENEVSRKSVRKDKQVSKSKRRADKIKTIR